MGGPVGSLILACCLFEFADEVLQFETACLSDVAKPADVLFPVQVLPCPLQEFGRELDWRDVPRLFAHGSLPSKTPAITRLLYHDLLSVHSPPSGSTTCQPFPQFPDPG